MTNVFSELEQNQIKRSLYPQELIPFLTDFFSIINIEFKENLHLIDQINGKTKEEYEKLLMFLYDEFITTVKGTVKEEKRPSTIKFLISKLLESFIFKNLESFYYYNLYNDKELYGIRRQLYGALDHIYYINFVTQDFILPSQIDRVLLDGEIYSSPKEIERLLGTSIKKSKFIYEHKLNKDYSNSIKNDEFIGTTWNNLEDKLLEKPSIVKVETEDVRLVTTNNNSESVKLEKFIFRELLFSKKHSIITSTTSNLENLQKDIKENSENGSLENMSKESLQQEIINRGLGIMSNNYLTQVNSQLKEIDGTETLLINLDLNKYKYLPKSNSLYFSRYESSLKCSSKLDYYLSLLVNKYTRKVKSYSEETGEEEILSTKGSILRTPLVFKELYKCKQVDCVLGLDYKNCKIDEFTNFKCPVELEYKGRIIRELDDIYLMISKLEDQDIFRVLYEDGTNILCCLDLNYFYILNLDLFTHLEIEGQSLELKKEKLVLKPKLKHGKAFEEYIENYLTEREEDYRYEYQDLRLVDIFKGDFNRNDISKMSKDFDNKLSNLEKELNFSKLLIKDLYE